MKIDTELVVITWAKIITNIDIKVLGPEKVAQWEKACLAHARS